MPDPLLCVRIHFLQHFALTFDFKTLLAETSETGSYARYKMSFAWIITRKFDLLCIM